MLVTLNCQVQQQGASDRSVELSHCHHALLLLLITARYQHFHYVHFAATVVLPSRTLSLGLIARPSALIRSSYVQSGADVPRPD